jgi:MFS family permease
MVLMYVLAPNWQVVALASLLQGFMVLQFPPESALIADSLSPEDRGKGVATMTTLAAALAIISPYLAGVIVDAYGERAGIRVLYGVMVVIYLASAAINHRCLKETASTAKSAFEWSALPRAFKDAYGGVLSLLKKLPRSLRAQAAIVILGLTCNAIASSFWVVYATEEIGLTATQWGSILLVETLLRTLLLIPAGIVADRHGRTRFMLASLTLSLLTMPAFVLCSNLVHVLLVRIVLALAGVCCSLERLPVARAGRGRAF